MKLSLTSCTGSGLLILRVSAARKAAAKPPMDGFMASREMSNPVPQMRS